jgi:hypothetical protein
VNDVRGNEQIVVDQLSRVALIAGDPGRLACRDDDIGGPMPAEERRDRRGLTHVQFAGAIQHVEPVAAERRNDSRANQRIGAGNKYPRLPIHERLGSREFPLEAVRRHFPDVCERI